MTQSQLSDAAMERRVLRKLDLHILPPLALLWLCNFIDRSNIGNAKIVGLTADTHLVGNQFNVALSVFYVSYILVEVPSNLVMKHMKPARWLCILVFAWGGVTTLTCLVKNFAGLVLIRLALGFCEGGLLPGIILYLSTIYKPHELQLRVGLFYASASLSGAFGGLLATGILNMDGVGNLAGWRWIFALEGLATVVSSLIAACFLPSTLAEAKFLSEEERQFALHRFHSVEGAPRRDSPEVSVEQGEGEKGSVVEAESATPDEPTRFMDEHFEMGEVIRGLTDFQAWVTAISYLGLIVSLYSFSLFLPTIVADLGYSGKVAELRTVPPYVPATVLTVVVAYVGYIISIAAKTNELRYAATFLIATGIYPCGPCILSILPNNGSGYYKRSTTIALQLAVANAGGFVAVNIYTPDQVKTFYRKGHAIVLGFLILSWIMAAVNVLYCVRENKAREKGLRQGNIAAYDELVRSGKTKAPIGDRHPDFRFTL
uniref:MFS transporter n=1 Tax=Mycena chlorophos TaxID=658473 RepID=A0ABQ0M7N7_MYCCL|nr:MFS transporter [Mycena chlorophos]